MDSNPGWCDSAHFAGTTVRDPQRERIALSEVCIANAFVDNVRQEEWAWWVARLSAGWHAMQVTEHLKTMGQNRHAAMVFLI
jgi:hypothetical protein